MPAIADAEIETFWRDGVVCLRGVLDAALVASMAEPVEAVLRAKESVDLATLADAPDTGKFIGGVDHWRTHPELAAFAFASPLPEIVAALLRSTRVYLYEDSVLAKEPNTIARTRWHQDLGYFHVDGTQLCTTWCPLDPATSATGAMSFVRASHADGVVYRPNLFVTDEPIPGTEGEPVPDIDARNADIVTFALEPGDITVHHARTLHAAGGNNSPTQRRRAISVRYCGDDARMRIRPGAPLKAEQHGLRDGDELGGDAHPQVWPPT